MNRVNYSRITGRAGVSFSYYTIVFLKMKHLFENFLKIFLAFFDRLRENSQIRQNFFKVYSQGCNNWLEKRFIIGMYSKEMDRTFS